MKKDFVYNCRLLKTYYRGDYEDDLCVKQLQIY